MNDNQLNSKIANAAKWSTVTQVISKIITPLTNMILARILVPEAFGIVATITMVVSFVEMFTDGGFQKYLIQHEFKNTIEKHRYANVAFWTNLTLSFLLWGGISFFNEQIANMVGNPGLGIVIIVACMQLPLTAFSSIQMALYRRDFDFRTLFIVRIIGIIIPLFVTIPLALLGFNYWSLIIGMISMQLFNAFYLTLKSNWKPKFIFDFKTLKKMFSFSMWSLIESISIWLTAWVDAFIISYFLNQYYLGIYKTSTVMVNSLLAVITAAIIPVLFSALSRLQNDNKKFIRVYFKFQRLVSILVFPLGLGVFLYSDLATRLMLGNQWKEASGVIGIWALTSAIMIVFGHFSSEVYRAKGKPKLSFLAQVLHLIFLVPTCIIAAKYGFWVLVYSRALIRLQFVMVHLIIMKKVMKINVSQTFKNVLPSIVATLIMGVFAYFLQQVSENVVWSIFTIILSIIFYFFLLLLSPKLRNEILMLLDKILPKKYKRILLRAE